MNTSTAASPNVSRKLSTTQLMTSKRIFGIFFILLAIVFTLAIIGLLPTLFGVFVGFFKIFTGKLDSFQIGEVIGNIIYWIFHIVATIVLWNYGVKWSRKQVKGKV